MARWLAEASRPASTLALTLGALTTQKQFEATADPTIVRRGVLKFGRDLEERRIAIAEEVIRHANPGPFEEPQLLALLAYQAASAEAAISMILNESEERATARRGRFILGTLPSGDVNAFATRRRAGLTIVQLNVGLVDFVYQAAKAVVAAQRPHRPADGRSAVAVNTDPERIHAGLRLDTAPVDHLYRTLETHFFEGRTRESGEERVPLEHHPPLARLIGMAERFVIAHEYGHGRSFQAYKRGSRPRSLWEEEYLADTHAVVTTVLSAALLDGMPPEFALDGGTFALACLRFRQQALALLRTGKARVERPHSTHPPYRLRIKNIVRAFYTFFDVEYDDATREFTVTLVLDRPTPPQPNATVRRHVDGGGFASANVLGILWEGLRELLLQDFKNGRPLHSMWM